MITLEDVKAVVTDKTFWIGFALAAVIAVILVNV